MGDQHRPLAQSSSRSGTNVCSSRMLPWVHQRSLLRHRPTSRPCPPSCSRRRWSVSPVVSPPPAAQLLGLIAELDRRSAWGTWGCRSMAHWLSWHAGIDIGAAREQVRTARALEVLALTAERFGRGELSYSKVRALTRIATPGTEADLIEIAATATASQLERFVQAYRRSLVAEEAAAERAIERRRLSWSWDDDGSLRVSARLPPEDGAQFLAGLASAAAALSSATIGTDHGQRHADALVAMAEGFLAAPPTTRTGGDRTQIVLHIEPEALADPVLDPACDPAARRPLARRPLARRPLARRAHPTAGWALPRQRGRRGPISRMAPGLRGRPCAACAATPALCPSSSGPTGRCSTSAGAPARSPGRFDERSPGVTRGAASPAATTRAGSMPTTSCTGPTAGRRNSRTSVFSVGCIIASSTRVGIASSSVLTARSRSAIPPDGCSSRSPPVPVPAGMPLPAVARQDALRATWAGERFDLDLAVSSTRWAQLREGAMPPGAPAGRFRGNVVHARPVIPRSAIPGPLIRPSAMGFNNPAMPWGELEARLSGKRLANGRAPGSPSWNAGGDGPAWSRKRQPFEPPVPERRPAGRPPPMPSCTATRTSPSSTVPRIRRSSPKRQPGSVSKRSRSPTTTGCTASSASPRRPGRSGCRPCSAPRSRSSGEVGTSSGWSGRSGDRAPGRRLGGGPPARGVARPAAR